MEEGVSPSLPRNGFFVRLSLEISDPFARELGLSQVPSLISVSLSRELVSQVVLAVGADIAIDLPAVLKGGSLYSSSGDESLPLVFGSVLPDPILCKRKGINFSLIPSGCRKVASYFDRVLKDGNAEASINETYKAGSVGLSSDLHIFVLTISDLVRSDDDVRPMSSVPHGVVYSFPKGSNLSDPSVKRMRLDPQECFKANLLEEMSGVTKMMPKTGVLDPAYKSLPSPVTGSIDLQSAGSCVLLEFGSGPPGPCVSSSRGWVLGFIGIGGHAQANGGVVPHFWDPFLVKTDPSGTEHCAMAIAASSDTGVDPIEVGNGDRFRNGKAPATRRKCVNGVYNASPDLPKRIISSSPCKRELAFIGAGILLKVAIADAGFPKKGSSRSDADSDDVDFSEKFRCAADAGSVGTVVAGQVRVTDKDVGDPLDAVDMERIWPSVCRLNKNVLLTVVPMLVWPTPVLSLLSSSMHVPLVFLELKKTELRGFLVRGRFMKGVPFPCATDLVIDGAISYVLMGFVSLGSAPETKNGGRAIPWKEVPDALFSGFRSEEHRYGSALGCRPAGA